MTQDEKINEIHARVIQLHTAINARGGLFDRIERIEKDLDDLRHFKIQVITAASLGAGLCSLLGSRLANLIPQLF